MIERQVEIGRCFGMEMNVEETKVMRISMETSPLQILIDQKQLENVKCFDCLGSITTNNTRYVREIKSKIVWQKH
jgi:hypothetical protein